MSWAADEDISPAARRQRERAKAWRAKHPERARARARQWQLQHPQACRQHGRTARTRYLYGISREQYDALLAEQQGRCAICGTTKPGKSGRFHYDHDHTTGEFRGFLCARCNLGIGYFQDRSELLRAAAAYVLSHRVPEVPRG